MKPCFQRQQHGVLTTRWV